MAVPEITGSHPWRTETLSTEDLAVWHSLPEDYREFLTRHNGGFVDPERAAFNVPLRRRFNGEVHHGTVATLEEFWAFLRYGGTAPEEGQPASLLHEHRDRHVEEGFLPSGVLAVARCASDSLVCLSTRPEDFGRVYYWEWSWQYPWYAEFFQQRVDQALAAFPRAAAVLKNPRHPKHQAVSDALNYATLVEIAPSFTGFLDGLHVDPDAAA